MEVVGMLGMDKVKANDFLLPLSSLFRTRDVSLFWSE